MASLGDGVMIQNVERFATILEKLVLQLIGAKAIADVVSTRISGLAKSSSRKLSVYPGRDGDYEKE